MPKTTSKDLGTLFDGMVKQMKDIVDNGEKEVTKDGEVVRVTPKAATLNVIRQFMRDQNINADASTHEGLQGLAKSAFQMPFEVPDDGRSPLQ